MKVLLGTVVLAAVFAGVAGFTWLVPGYEGAAEAQPSPGAPNIVLILLDDASRDTLPAMPIAAAELGEKGTTFDNFVFTLARCCPSRASMLTGKYPHNTGVLDNRAPEGGEPGFREGGNETDTVAAALDDAGYQTGLFGKYLNDYDDASHIPAGWDHWFAAYHKAMWPRCFSSDGSPACFDGHPDNIVADKAEAFVAKNAAEAAPLFMWVSFSAPHGPALYARADRGKFAGETVPRNPAFDEADVSDKPAYIQDNPPLTDEQKTALDKLYVHRLRSVGAVDRAVGQLIEAFAKAGELKNTYFFFTTDNGLHMGEHRMMPGKETPYSADTEFPLLVRGPGVGAGITNQRLVGNIDLGPTFAELGGAQMPNADGRSIAPLLLGESPPWRDALLIENPIGAAKSGSPPYSALRTPQRSYVEYANGEREFYDLSTDPYQLENAYEKTGQSYRELLAARLRALEECAGETCRAAEDAQP